MKVSKNFQEMCEIYRIFADDYCDFSDNAKQEMYDFETFGKGSISIDGFNTIGKKSNGFAVGKKWLNVTVAMWMDELSMFKWEEDPNGKYTHKETGKLYNFVENRIYIGWYNTIKRLYSDPMFPHWWLNKVFEGYFEEKINMYEEILPDHKEEVIQLIKDIKNI